jgi:glycosyltransferase involved in cell wall biosynthesis
MDDIPPSDFIFKNKRTKGCRLLLVGVSWENKGAGIAVNALSELLKMGIDAHLTVCGCTPPQPITNNQEHLTIIPFLNKNSEEGRKQLEELFLSHSFFILPTRFDCTPIVFCEASAYALPVLSSNTGGVGGHVKDGRNGFLIDYNDQGIAYAEKIKEIWSDRAKYEALCHSARALYEEQLNWEKWGKAFGKEVNIEIQKYAEAQR